jgi:3-oxoacyl-[acyl-carrier protein] reductase
MIDFTDRIVLITGASGGIGSATAETIVSNGGRVVIHDIHLDGRLSELHDRLGDRAHPIAADLTDVNGVVGLWERAVEWQGRIDVLINNAGIYERADVDSPLADWQAAWERMVAICLIAPATLCREAIKTFRSMGGGIIINLASRAAWRGEDADYMHYAATKAGVVAMTKTIARQFGRDGVTAYAVAPGFVDTPFNTAPVEEYGIEFFANDTALGEVAQPQDLANVIAFLASGLARHATGATIDVNGGSYVR